MGRPSAGLLVFAETTGRFLLLRRSAYVNNPGFWSCPAGRIDRGEAPIDAAVREFYEEAGYAAGKRGMTVDPVALLDPGKRRRFFYFRGLVPTQFVPRLNWESDGWGWFYANDLPKPMHPGMVRTLPLLGTF